MSRYQILRGIGGLSYPEITTLRNTKPLHFIQLSIFSLLVIGVWRYSDLQGTSGSLQHEIWVGWITWAVIFISAKRSRTHTETEKIIYKDANFWSASWLPWVLAVAIVSSQLLSSQHPLPWSLPLTTLCVSLTTHWFLTPNATDIENPEKDNGDDEDIKERLGSRFALRVNLVICALFTIICWDRSSTTFQLIGLTLLFAITRSVAIICASNWEPLETEQERLPTLKQTFQYLDLVALPTLTVWTVIFVIMQPKLDMSNTTTLIKALVQIAWWVTSLGLLRLKFANTIANLDTLAWSLQTLSSSTNLTVFLAQSVAGFLSVAQSLAVLRPSVWTRRIICAAFAACILVAGLYNGVDIRSGGAEWNFTSSTHGHPIERAIAKNRALFADIVARQSTTIEEAVRVYEQKHGRRPPKGFNKWFELAMENDFVLVDEFDTLMQSLEPFHGLPTSIIHQRNEVIANNPTLVGRTNHVRFESGTMTVSELNDWLGNELTKQEWAHIVPYNMSLYLNWLDEPMVNVPWTQISALTAKAKMPDKKLGDQHQSYDSAFINTERQSGWAATRDACSIEAAARQFECPTANHNVTRPLPFIENATASYSICDNCELIDQHGVLLSPTTFYLTHELVPVWSAAKPSHFNDILYPAPYYMTVRGDYKGNLDSDWHRKDNKFYWTGSNTGGWSTKETWKKMLRQRLVMKTNAAGVDDEIQLLEQVSPGSDLWTPRYSTMAEVENLFTTRITNIVQCDDDVCEEQKEAFGLNESRPGDPMHAAYSHKFVMDVDGNGLSGRFYRLLQSKSVTIKQTIMQEWHDDRLIPWVHYVPLSTSLDELPEMARFLATTDEGLKLSERIAEESTIWHGKALRDIDLQLVFLRLVLEWGRLMDPEAGEL